MQSKVLQSKALRRQDWLLQQERIAAYREYIADVTTGAFPESRHITTIDDEALAKVWGQ